MEWVKFEWTDTGDLGTSHPDCVAIHGEKGVARVYGNECRLKASFVAYPIVNALHIMSIGALLTSVMLMDLRIVGAFGSVPREPFVALLRRTAFVAFVGAFVTGSLLFSVKAREYAAMPIFLAKMTLILLASANLLAFIRLSRTPSGDGAVVTVLTVLSLVLWISVLFAGRFIGFL